MENTLTIPNTGLKESNLAGAIIEKKVKRGLKELREHAGSQILFRIEQRNTEDWATVDYWAGEEVLDSKTLDLNCTLENICLGRAIPSGKEELPQFFLVKSRQGQMLVPFRYYYSTHFSVRCVCREMHSEIIQATMQDGSVIDLSPRTSYVFDGYISVDDSSGILSKEDKRYIQEARFPILSKQNCKYDLERCAITGDINNLLRGCVLLWK